jgi:hypothetical protein
MRAIIGLAGLLLVGGCGGDKTITVGANTLTVRDQGYFYSDSHDYCDAGGAGQMMLDFVDYNFLCDPQHAPQKDPEAPHVELRIILTQGPLPDHLTHPNMGLPYDSTLGATPSCDVGGAGADIIIGQFRHYPNGHDGTAPDQILYANSAHLLFTQYDPTKMKPNEGNYELHFGADTVKGSFSIFNCN